MIPTLYIIAFVIITIFLTIATEIEWFGWTTLTILGSVAAVQFFHLFNIWLYIKDHIFQTTMYTIAYIAIGVVWSFAKWFFFLINERDKSRAYIQSNMKSASYNAPKINIPKASDNKSKIIAWISYWPFSAVGTILNDPFRKLFNLIFNQFKNLYQQMANSIYEKDVIFLKIHIEELAEKEKEFVQKEINEAVKIKNSIIK